MTLHIANLGSISMLYKIWCAVSGATHTWCAAHTCAVCDGVDYMRRCDRTSVHLCASSLQDLAVSQDIYSLVSISVNDLSDPVFDGVGLVGFKSKANAILLAKLLAPFLSPVVFPLSSFILWVGVVGLGSSD